MVAVLPSFVPAVTVPKLAVAEPASISLPRRRTKRALLRRRATGIEVAASSITVRIGDRASPTAIAAVIVTLNSGT